MLLATTPPGCFMGEETVAEVFFRCEKNGTDMLCEYKRKIGLGKLNHNLSHTNKHISRDSDKEGEGEGEKGREREREGG